MKKIKNNRWVVLLPAVMLLILFILPHHAFCRGFKSHRSFGGSRSWSGSGKRSSSPKSRKSIWTTKRKSPSTKSKNITKGKNRADKALAKKAKAAGTSFKNKNSALQDFKTKHSSKYTSKYTTKPSKRPDHIPKTTEVSGKRVDITYRNSGYGYMHNGSWIFYDVMRDAVMLDLLMNRHSYYYPGYGGVYRSGMGGLFAGFIVITIIVVMALIILLSFAKAERG